LFNIYAQTDRQTDRQTRVWTYNIQQPIVHCQSKETFEKVDLSEGSLYGNDSKVASSYSRGT